MTFIDLDYKKRISAYLEAEKYSDLENFITDNSIDEVQLVDFIITASFEERKRFFLHNLYKHVAIIVTLPEDIKNDIFESFDSTRSFAEIINPLEPDEIRDIISDFDYTLQEEIISFLDNEKAKALQEILSYPEQSAGRLINKDFLIAKKEQTASQTIKMIKENLSINAREHYEIFVLSNKSIPIGKLSISKLLCADEKETIENLMDTNFHTIDYGLNQEDVATIFRKYSLISAPVVNSVGKMIGIIHYDEIISVIVEEAEEDLLLLGKVSESDLDANLWETFSRRIPWLFVTFCTINVASFIVGLFNETLQKSVEIVILMPIIAAMAGNAGIQASTIALRAVINGTISHLNSKRLVIKEIITGLINGSIIAIVSGIIVMFRFQDVSVMLSFCTSMTLVVTIATFMGSAVPIILNRIGLDPALSSSIFVSSVTDILSFFILLAVATLILL